MDDKEILEFFGIAFRENDRMWWRLDTYLYEDEPTARMIASSTYGANRIQWKIVVLGVRHGEGS